jgi:glucose-fructose oxidoreductase
MHGTPLIAPGEEGLKDTLVVEAIYRSAASGRKVSVG